MNRGQRIVVRLLATALMVVLAAWVLWPEPEPRVLPSATTPAMSEDASPTEPLATLARDLMSALTRATRVRFVVMDGEGEPLPGVELVVMDGQHGVTDTSGELVVDGLSRGYWREPEVLGPWFVLHGSTEGPTLGAEQTRLIYLAPSCPGVVRVEQHDGTPVQGASVGLGWNHDILRTGTTQPGVTTDRHGEATMTGRPCGLVNFRVSLENGSVMPQLGPRSSAPRPSPSPSPASRRPWWPWWTTRSSCWTRPWRPIAGM